MKPKRHFLVAAQSNDLDWITMLMEKMEIGVEIKDFALAGATSGGTERSFELWHVWRSAMPRPVSMTVHAPFHDLIPGSLDPEAVELAFKRHEETLTAAEALGAKAVLFHSGYNPMIRGPGYRERWLENTARYFRKLMERHASITFLIENMWEPNPDPIIDLIDTVNDPRFRACLDVGHVQIYSQLLPDAWIQKLGIRLGHLHLNDNDGAWDQEMALGTGIVPVARVFPALDGLGYYGTITLEVRGMEAVLRSIEHLRKLGLE